MNAIKSFAAFLYDFIVGDDWRMSLAVVLGLAATALAVHSGFNPWWLVPLFVAGGLGISLRRVVRKNGGS
ncbi:MAG: hypothetical protein WCP81_04800 [Actinomycetes bacterium]